jgi:hypothetical protein
MSGDSPVKRADMALPVSKPPGGAVAAPAAMAAAGFGAPAGKFGQAAMAAAAAIHGHFVDIRQFA